MRANLGSNAEEEAAGPLRGAAGRRSGLVAALGVAVLVVAAFAAVSLASAGATRLTYEGNSSREHDEPLSFVRKTNPKAIAKARRKLGRAERRVDRAETRKDKKAASRRVRQAERELAEAERGKVKDFAMGDVALNCKQRPFRGMDGPEIDYTAEQSLPLGAVYEGRNAARVVRGDRFRLRMRSNRHPDEGQLVVISGKLHPAIGDAPPRASGKLTLSYETYNGDGGIKCASGAVFWTAELA